MTKSNKTQAETLLAGEVNRLNKFMTAGVCVPGEAADWLVQAQHKTRQYAEEIVAAWQAKYKGVVGPKDRSWGEGVGELD